MGKLKTEVATPLHRTLKGVVKATSAISCVCDHAQSVWRVFRRQTRRIHSCKSARAIGKIDSARAATTGVVAARGPSRSSPVLPLRARSVL
ncbi:hypothetical protein J6590_074183 [Homalodisca vitripennis]|nr:hypothetical protein J6590_074183 [Homalodisca vitripennis]